MNDDAFTNLVNAGVPLDTLQRWMREKLPLDEVWATVHSMLDRGMTISEILQEDGKPQESAKPAGPRKATPAAAFEDADTKYLWYPYLPRGDFTVLMAPGGVGKTLLICGIAAAVTTGRPLPGDEFSNDPKNVLIISAEDPGPLLKKRLAACGADLMRTFILDCSASTGLNFDSGFDEFEATVLAYVPALVVLDPWHAYLDSKADINRVNVLRPILQKLSLLAKKGDLSMILISHVNKKEQSENANNAAIGSADFVNASRSAMRLIKGEEDDERIVIHTKSNYSRAGQSVKFNITDEGGVEWTGFSDVTKETLELAARRRSTPWEVMQTDESNNAASRALVQALKDSANSFTPTRFTYDDFKRQHGDLIFGALQPKKALDAVKDELTESGYYLKTGIQVKKGGVKGNGFLIQKIETTPPEQAQLDGT